MRLEYDKKYYEALHKWFCEIETGVYKITQIAKPETMEKLINHVKYWITIREFWDEGFYLEFDESYQYIVKGISYVKQKLTTRIENN